MPGASDKVKDAAQKKQKDGASPRPDASEAEEDLGDELFLGEIDRAYRDRSSIASRLAEFEIRDSVLMISDIVIEIAGGKMT